jgi:CheY-like chemotaxis protein
MSGSNLPEDVHRAYALGANRYMVKPSDPSTLRQQFTSLVENWCEYTELVERGAPGRLPGVSG